MRNLFQNFQTIFYTLIAIGVLSINYRKVIRTWREKPPVIPAHWALRIASGVVTLLAFSFLASLALAPSSKYVWINTVCSFLLLSSYIAKVLVDLRKYGKKQG